MKNKFTITVQLFDGIDAQTITIIGRDAWALQELVNAGAKGCTPLDHPGPRWSGYVHKLRKQGIHVETIHEHHGGAFPGRHARYVLCSQVEIVSTNGAGAA